MDISDWQDAPRPILAASSAKNSISPIWLGVVGTLILHAFIIQSVYFGARQHKNRLPDIQRLAQVAQPSGSGDSLVTVELAAVKKGGQVRLDDNFSKTLNVSNLNRPIDVVMPPILNTPLTLNDEEGSDTAGLSADVVERSRLFGIYAGQIQARIERVWRRPRTPVTHKPNEAIIDTGESFKCEAQIVQDALGNVQEVLLPLCSGMAAWQRSLMIAIQQASPLPAPPNASVFTSSIILRFLAFPYGSGRSDDEYELPSVQSAKNSN